MKASIRVAVAQIDTRPAYLSASAALVAEPTGQDLGLNLLGPVSSMLGLRETSRQLYLTQLRARVEAIVSYCASKNVNLLIFPEYSIPPELLQFLADSSKDANMYIVAGTHSIPSTSPDIYRGLGLNLNCSSKDPNSDIKKAICPILCPNGQHAIYFKANKSKWEEELVLSPQSWNWVTAQIGHGAIHIGVLVCIDALRFPHIPASQYPAIMVIPARSPSTEEFTEFSRLQVLNETPVAFANDAHTGMSKIYGAYGSTNRHPLMTPDGTLPIPKGEEAVVIADVVTEGQFLATRTALDHWAIGLVAFAPLLYLSVGECQRFHNLAEQTRQDFQVDRLFDPATAPEIPGLLTRKISLLSQISAIGGLRREVLDLYIGSVDIPESVLPPAALECEVLSAYDTALLKAAQEGSADRRHAVIDVWTRIEHEMAQRKQALAGVSVPSEMTSTLAHSTSAIGKPPFQDRDTELSTIRRFSNNALKRMLAVFGIRGLGKTRLVDESIATVFPNRTCFKISLTEGTGFPRFILDLAYKLGLRVEPEEEANLGSSNNCDDFVLRLLQAFDKLNAACLVLDDWHHAAYKSAFKDPLFGRFLDLVFQRPTYTNNKVIIISRQYLDFPAWTDTFVPLRLSILDSDSMRAILDWHIKLHRTDASPVEVPAILLERLHGNPLAAVVAAQLLDQFPIDQVVNHAGVQQRFQERLIPLLLDKMPLSEEELRLIEYASVFNTDVEFELLQLYPGPGDVVKLLPSLVDKFLLEYDISTQKYRVHPLVREHFDQLADFTDQARNHAIAATYYEAILQKNPTSPSAKGELVGHLAASLQWDKAKHLSALYYEELRPVARRLFKSHDYKLALEYYRVLSSIREDDSDAFFHVALCYGHLGNWDKAVLEFDKAINLKRDGWWIYAGFSDVLIRHRHDTDAAEKYLLQALEVADRAHAAKWRYSAIYESLGKLYTLKRNWEKAEASFRQAVAAHPTSGFPHYYLAKHLWRTGGDLGEALREVNRSIELDETIIAATELRRQILADIHPVEDEASLDQDVTLNEGETTYDSDDEDSQPGG